MLAIFILTVSFSSLASFSGGLSLCSCVTEERMASTMFVAGLQVSAHSWYSPMCVCGSCIWEKYLRRSDAKRHGGHIRGIFAISGAVESTPTINSPLPVPISMLVAPVLSNWFHRIFPMGANEALLPQGIGL